MNPNSLDAAADVPAFLAVPGLTEVPNTPEDDAVVAAYESAKERFIRALTEDAEEKIHESYSLKRAVLDAEIESLRTLFKVHEDAAKDAVARYATRLPHRVSKTGIRPPSLWERILTFNAIGAIYRKAAEAMTTLDDANERLRKKRAQLDALVRESRRAIYLREEQARKKLHTPEGLAALHGDPEVQAAYLRAQAVMERRAEYQRRVERGEVPPEEARDREMTDRGQAFAEVPLDGVILARVVRYGLLQYYVLRDLANREFLLSCNPLLEPLCDLVFDVTKGTNGYDAALRYSADGAPMRVLDHLKATRTGEEAADLYAVHRSALRGDRPTRTTVPHDEAEDAMIGVLLLLADAVEAQSAAPPEEP